jgi:uracil-DNA glycosylase family 4
MLWLKNPEEKGYVHPVHGTGDVLLLGEAGGREEAREGRPFVGASGFQLDRLLRRLGVSRSLFHIDNVVRCQPPNNWLEGAPWEEEAVEYYRAEVAANILRIKPKAIVPLGGMALKWLLGLKGIADTRAPKRGYVYDLDIGGHQTFVVPTYHPAYILRGEQRLTQVACFDISKALRICKEGYKEPPYTYVTQPSVLDLADFVDHADDAMWCAADIETNWSPNMGEEDYEISQTVDKDEIESISFAYANHHAITVPWTNQFIPEISRLLRRAKGIVFWNSNFDLPRLRRAGCDVGGTVYDAMWMWHFYQSDLPKSLGFVGSLLTELTEWKSLSQEAPAFYACRDSHATLQIANKLRDVLVKEGRWDRFVRHFVELEPKLYAIGRAGVLVDPVRKQELYQHFNTKLLVVKEKLNNEVPEGVKRVKLYKRLPKTAAHGSQHGKDGGTWDLTNPSEPKLLFPFSSNSPKQVLGYIRNRGHKVPRNYKTERDTSGAKEIEALSKRYKTDKVYPLILEERKYSKIIGQYLDGYEADADGRLRTTFTQKPSTLRMSSENPNVHNYTRRDPEAQICREMFVASPDHVLVELDYKSIEAVIAGYLAGDAEYVQAAKIGVHAILVSHIQGKPINPLSPTAKAEAKAIKRDFLKLYDQAKPIVYLSNYKGTPTKIRMEYPDLFKTTGEAERLQEMYFSTIARKIRKWQSDTLTQAMRQNFLDNPFGYRHWFWDVGYVIKDGMVQGTDAKRALAFGPQSIAAAILKEAILRLTPNLFDCLRWPIHDSLLFEFPSMCAKELAWKAKQIMETPIPELGGLVIEVEGSYGLNWGSASLTNPDGMKEINFGS